MAKNQLPPTHLSMGKKKNKTKPPQRRMETATANLQAQSHKQRKRHRARTAKNPTKIQTNHTSRLNHMLLPEINKLTNNLIHVPDPAISHAHGSSNSQQTPISIPANPNLSHASTEKYKKEKRGCWFKAEVSL